MTRLRSLFQAEWTWRLFLVLSIVGLIGIGGLTVVWQSWTPLDFLGWTEYQTDEAVRIQLECEQDRENAGKYLFEFLPGSVVSFPCQKLGSDFTGAPNWFFLLFVFGPFALAKSVDWIVAGRAKP